MKNTQIKDYIKNLDNFDHSMASTEKNNTQMLEEVFEGLNKPQKELPSKYFYDERGSKLFDQICHLDEYYPTRTELGIMKHNIDEISDVLGDRLMFIEYGSGSSEKIKIILDHIKGIKVYVPIDISGEHLIKSAAQIATQYKHIEIIPLCADYNTPFIIPQPKSQYAHKIVYFPGSTIGNFHPPEAVSFLSKIAKVSGDKGGLLIGVDLKKDRQILHNAYNDRQGITAEFNLNQLRHINNTINTNFNLQEFEHDAFYNSGKGRIEMHLVSKIDQKIKCNGSHITFKQGETIWTESSYKYDLDEFAELAQDAGFRVCQVWTDKDHMFSVQYLEVV